MGLKARPQSLKVWFAGPPERRTSPDRIAHGVIPHRQFQRTHCRPSPAPGSRLRVPQSGDHAEWAALREASRTFLTPWEPTWPVDDLTRGAFRRRLKRYAEDQRSDLAYAFLIFRSDDDAMVGGLTLANIRRGVAQAGTIGYWIGAPFAHHGYMTAAVRALIPFCFGTLRLHRWRRPAFRPIPRRSASWKRPASRARAMRAAICASTASGRTICFMPGSRTTGIEAHDPP